MISVNGKEGRTLMYRIEILLHRSGRMQILGKKSMSYEEFLSDYGVYTMSRVDARRAEVAFLDTHRTRGWKEGSKDRNVSVGTNRPRWVIARESVPMKGVCTDSAHHYEMNKGAR